MVICYLQQKRLPLVFSAILELFSVQLGLVHLHLDPEQEGAEQMGLWQMNQQPEKGNELMCKIQMKGKSLVENITTCNR